MVKDSLIFSKNRRLQFIIKKKILTEYLIKKYFFHVLISALCSLNSHRI